MKICHILICFFSLTALRDANTVFSAGITVLTVNEGGNVTYDCKFSFPLFEKMKTFCRKECQEEDVLIRTTKDMAQHGRYSIEYKPGTLSSILQVSITKLTKSDSGRYRCDLDRFFPLNSKENFEIRVNDAPVTSKLNSTPGAFSPAVPTASSLTPAQSLSSTSGSSTPSSSSSEASEQPEQQQRSAAGPGVLLYVGPTLLAAIGVLSAAVLIICRRRAGKRKEPPVETEYANVTAANRVYVEAQEESRQSGSPPEQTTTVYSFAIFAKLSAAKATDDYSVVTAARSQTTTEDESSKLTYSEVNFSGRAASLNSAPCGDAENVVYSAPRVEGAPPPLYSTLTLPQL